MPYPQGTIHYLILSQSLNQLLFLPGGLTTTIEAERHLFISMAEAAPCHFAAAVKPLKGLSVAADCSVDYGGYVGN